MLAKCANPSCSTSLRYLSDGRFFRLEIDMAESSKYPFPSTIPRRAEYFWLCTLCAKSVTLRLGQSGAVITEALAESARGSPEDFAIISRHEGKLLRSVIFARVRPQSG